jgi:TonB family protein
MNYLFAPLLFPLLALFTFSGALAQVRKTALPVDTGVLNVAPPTIPFGNQPKPQILLSEPVFFNPFLTPEYPGGTNAMYRFIEHNLKIPAAAKEASINGRVFTSFTVEVTGEITNVTVLKGLGFGCDEEAVRLIQSMPLWKPGKELGKIVKVKYNLPISFVTK